MERNRQQAREETVKFADEQRQARIDTERQKQSTMLTVARRMELQKIQDDIAIKRAKADKAEQTNRHIKAIRQRIDLVVPRFQSGGSGGRKKQPNIKGVRSVYISTSHGMKRITAADPRYPAVQERIRQSQLAQAPPPPPKTYTEAPIAPKVESDEWGGIPEGLRW